MAIVKDRYLLGFLSALPITINGMFYIFILFYWPVTEIGRYTHFNLIIFFCSFVTPLWHTIQLQDTKISPDYRFKIARHSIRVSIFFYLLGILFALSGKTLGLAYLSLIMIGIADQLSQRYLVFLVGNNRVVLSQIVTILAQAIMYVVLMISIINIDLLILFLCAKLAIGLLVVITFYHTKPDLDAEISSDGLQNWTTNRKIEVHLKTSFGKISQHLEKTVMMFFGYNDLGVVAILMKPYEVAGSLFKTLASLEIRRNLKFLTQNFFMYLLFLGILASVFVGVAVSMIAYYKLQSDFLFISTICVLFIIAISLMNYASILSYLDIYLSAGKVHVNAVLLAALSKIFLTIPLYSMFGFEGLLMAIVLSILFQSLYMRKRRNLRGYFAE